MIARTSLIATLLLTVPVWADDFRTTAPVTDVTVYYQGARITRTIEVEVPAGAHRILAPISLNQLQGPPRVRATGDFTIGSIEQMSGLITDPSQIYSPDQAAAFNRVEAADRATVAKMDEIAKARTDLAAALASIDFLKSVKGSALTGIDPDSLQATAAMIGTQIGQAEADRVAVEQRLRALQESLTDLQKAAQQARSDFQRLYPPQGPVDMLAISVTLAEPQTVRLEVDGLSYNAGWAPYYELRLDTETGTIEGQRKAQVRQNTGEIWQDVDLVLSTANPFASVIPAQTYPDIARIQHNDLRKVRTTSKPTSSVSRQSLGAFRGGSGDAAEAAPVLETFQPAAFDGVAVTYAYGRPLTMAPGGDGPTLRLGDFSLETELKTMATPEYDQTAFVVADLRNTLAEPILAGQAELYRDGSFVGSSAIGLIPAGAEADISFGPLESVRLDYKVLDNDTGDRGVVSRSNTRQQTMEFTVENLGAEPETVTALFSMPFSEQDDLSVDVRARPAPTTEDYEKQRGVGAWELALAPGAKITVEVDVDFTWPTDQQLQWRP